MHPPDLPREAVELAARGHWIAAWTGIAADFPRLLRTGSVESLLWMHDLCLRLGLDTRRRLLGRVMKRRAPEHEAVRARAVLELVRRGRLADAFEATRAGLPDPSRNDTSVPWLLARARVAHELRDHDTAGSLLDVATRLAPDEPTVVVERLWALQSADRIDEALALAAAAASRFGGHPAVTLAECWIRHDANVPGLQQHLAEVRRQLQSPYLDAVHANLLHESGDLAGARTAFEAVLALPWLERDARIAWSFGLVRICRELGDDAAALQWAEATGRAGAKAAERLRSHLAAPPDQPTRVVLPVPFVRQDHQTCSPATMASLLAFFGIEVAQREIAAQITWDGTASHDELKWARQRGLVVRFFQWDADAARDLLDRGLPFAISTRFETNGHRQAVVGYDRVLDSFLLRDPTGHFRREVDSAWLESTMQRGGDCTLLLPASAAASRAPATLPAEAETTAWLDLRLDIEARRLDDVPRRVEALLAVATGPLRFDIETRVLHERGDRNRQLELYRQAWERNPAEPYRQYQYAAELLDQDRWQEARTFLEQTAPGSPSPFLHRMLADQWAHDATRRPAALAMMRRALRRLGREPRTWHRHASYLWDDDRRDEATGCYRIAAMLAPMDEWLAGSYFRALRGIGRTDEGLAFLRRRADVAIGRSAGPAGSLAEALESLHKPDEAIAALRQALASDDTPAQRDRLCQLLLRHHRHDEAAALLAEANRFAPVDHALRSHQLAQARHDAAGARAALQAAVEAQPTHVGAQLALLEDLLAGDGVEAAVAHADRLVAAFPDHPKLLVEIAAFHRRIDDHARNGALLRQLVRSHPDQHWLKGRLARHCIARGALDEAEPLVEELLRTSPRSSAVLVDAADLAHARGQLDLARAHATRAVELAPADGSALRNLLNLARNRDEAVAAVRLVLRLLLERPQAPSEHDLAGLVGVVDVLPDGEFDAFLQRLGDNFPNESAIAVARCNHLRADSPTEALAIAERLVAREGWRTDHRMLLAHCLRACNRRNDERTALEDLLRLDPTQAQAFVELGESFDEEGRLPQAVAAFERGLRAAPGYAALHGMLADARWRLGEPDGALAAAARACELDPAYAWAFDARVRWLVELGRNADAVALSTRIVADNPRWATAYDLHATALAAVGRHDERIVALQQALALSPRLGTTRLVLVDAMIGMKRFAEAAAVVAEGLELLGDDPRLQLRQVTLVRAQGRLEEARAQLRELLARHPDYEFGWRRLLSWCEEERLDDEILALHRDPPAALRDDPVLYGHAGDALRRRGDVDGACRALEQALAKNQGYTWARDTLSELLHDRGDHAKVLELLPDHAHPERLPWRQAVIVGKACVHLGRFAVSYAALERLLRDPTGRGMDVPELAELLRGRDSRGLDTVLHRVVGDRCTDLTVWANWLRILSRRGDDRSFWREVDRAHAAPAARDDLLPLVRAIVDVSRDRKLVGLDRWARRHVRQPITDIRLVGELMYLLCGEKAEQRELLRLFADHWRRPDVEGWMLANMSSAFVDLERFDEAEQVAQYAHDTIPHDHSFWWFQRDRAEIALRRGQWAACRAAYREAPAEYPTVCLAFWQIDLCAELHQLPWWRRGAVLRRRLRRSFALRDAALDEARATGSLWVKDLWRACPGPTTALLACGRVGRWLVRRVLLRA
ncbi:MAG: tetratricopeptide repeat protein [Planctomycetes bacterium]|nr:tetratricopeptide repeat protein [Planctomycetota bacterium]